MESINKVNPKLSSLVVKLVNNYHPEKVILFGSATSEAVKPNDFDLLVVKETSTRRIRRREEALKNLEHNIPLDIIVLTPKEVNLLYEKKSMWIKEIMQKGIVLYGE
jgi:uncharacterized protein